MKRMSIITASALALGLLAATSRAADVDVTKLPPASVQVGVTYVKNVRPLFEKSCFKCHGPEKQKGDLRVDSLAATLKGSEYGKIVVPGNSAKSRLVWNVARIVDEDEWMPPVDQGEPLKTEEIALLRAWIDQGAK